MRPAQGVASQKQAMKKVGAIPPASAAEPAPEPAPEPLVASGGRKKPLPTGPQSAPVSSRQASAVDVVESAFVLAQQVGDMDQLKRLVDTLAMR